MTSLAKASVNYNTFPIFTAVYARIFLNEPLYVWDWVAILIACFGMALMGRPWKHSEQELDLNFDLDRIGQLLAIFGSIIVSFAYMLMRRIAGRMYLMIPPLYLSVTSNLLIMPLALWMYSEGQDGPTHYTWQDALIIIGIGVSTLIG